MDQSAISYHGETAADDAVIEEINEEAFGPGRFARAAFRIREGGPHDRALSFVARHGDTVVGSVCLTPVTAGDGAAHLLGPLAVRPDFKNRGIGRKLVSIALDAAREAGSPAVILVGDAPYYGPFGFAPVPAGKLRLPGPVDPRRLLIAELSGGATEKLSGVLCHADVAAKRVRSASTAFAVPHRAERHQEQAKTEEACK